MPNAQPNEVQNLELYCKGVVDGFINHGWAKVYYCWTNTRGNPGDPEGGMSVKYVNRWGDEGFDEGK